MNCYEAAEILKSGVGDVVEARLVLEEMPVKHVEAASIAVELLPVIKGWATEKGFEGDLSEVVGGIAGVLDKEIGRIGKKHAEYWQMMSVWLRGYQIEGWNKILTHDRWALTRKAVREYLAGVKLEDLSVVPEGGTLVDELRPVFRKLKKKSMEAIDSEELTPDKTLRAFTDITRLYGTATSELSRVDVQIGPNEAFKAILDMSRDRVAALPAEYELLE